MALQLSTGLRNAILGDPIARTDGGSQIAFVSSSKTITDTESEFLTDGFRPSDLIVVTNSAGSNDLNLTVEKVEAGTITVTENVTDEAAGDATPTLTARSKSLKDIFKYGCLRIYTGSQPANADAAETGTKLLEITVGGGALTPGTSTNGLEFGDVTTGTLAKNTDTWSDTALATGTAGWWRLYDNGRITGASSSGIRMDGSIATSGSTITISNTSIKTGEVTTVDKFSPTMLAS